MSGGRSSGKGGSAGRTAHRIEARFARWDEFLDARLDVNPAGLFLAGSFDLDVGDDVVAHCSFPDDADGARFAGRVLWRRLRGGSQPGLLPGIGVVLRTSSITAFRRVVEHAEGTAGLAGRKQERFTQTMSIQCVFGRRNPVDVAGEVIDISVSGVAIRVAHRPSVDDPVFLTFDDRLLGTIEAAGFVTWVRGGPPATGTTASVGVELRFTDDVDRNAWERIVGRAKAEARISAKYGDG